MPNVGKITVDNPDEILNAGAYGAGAVIRVQWSATETGTYADISGTGSTPTITVITATRIYTFYDPVGTSSTWYRTRYENVGATRLSDWSGSFQVGDETGGLICSLWDAKERLDQTTTTVNDEAILGFIADATSDIEGYTRRWLVPRTAATYLFSPSHTGRTLFIPKGARSVTALGYASSDQPDTGGTYTSIASTYYSMWPPEIERSPGWPATGIVLLDTAPALFYAGINTVQVTFSGGWSAVPHEVQGVGLNLVVGLYRAQGSGGGDVVTVGMDGERTFERILSFRDLAILKRYRDWA